MEANLEDCLGCFSTLLQVCWSRASRKSIVSAEGAVKAAFRFTSKHWRQLVGQLACQTESREAEKKGRAPQGQPQRNALHVVAFLPCLLSLCLLLFSLSFAPLLVAHSHARQRKQQTDDNGVKNWTSILRAAKHLWKAPGQPSVRGRRLGGNALSRGEAATASAVR